MATQKVIPIAVPSQVPAENISQLELTALCSLRKRAEQLEEEIANAETSIRARLEAGADVEAGLLRAFLKITERKNVSWKSVVERELGEDYARRVLAATKPDTYTSLVVSA